MRPGPSLPSPAIFRSWTTALKWSANPTYVSPGGFMCTIFEPWELSLWEPVGHLKCSLDLSLNPWSVCVGKSPKCQLCASNGHGTDVSDSTTFSCVPAGLSVAVGFQAQCKRKKEKEQNRPSLKQHYVFLDTVHSYARCKWYNVLHIGRVKGWLKTKNVAQI